MRTLNATNAVAMIVTLALSCLIIRPAKASFIVTEDFSYANGSIAGNNGGENGLGNWTTAWAEAGSAPITNHLAIQAEQLNAKPAAGSANVSRSFSSTVDPGTTLYFAMDLIQTNNSEGGYDTRLHLLGGTVKMGYLNDDIRVDLGTANNVFSPGATDTGSRYLVARVEFNEIGSDEVLTFWIDPTSELDVPEFTLQADIGATDLGSLVNFVKSGQEGNVIFFDNFAIGTDFNFVAPTPIPEPSSLLLLGGTVALTARRRRQSRRRE